MIQLGIKNLDEALGDSGFPLKGFVTITGDSEFHQYALLLHIAKHIGANFPKILVLSTRYGQWTTRDIFHNAQNVVILDVEQESVSKTIQEIHHASNRDEYPMVIIDHMEDTGTMLDGIAIKTIIQNMKGELTIVHCLSGREKKHFDIKNLLIGMSEVSFKFAKQPGAHGLVNVSILGKNIRHEKSGKV